MPAALLAFALPLAAHAYTCDQLAADNAKSAVTSSDLNGFESIDQRLTITMNMELEGMTVGLAEMAYKELIAQGASQSSAYKQSVNRVFRDTLRIEGKTKDLLAIAIRDAGGINKFVTKMCVGRKADIEAIFRAIWLGTQKEESK